MGQLLITKPVKDWYHSIVSIRNYSENDFEDKLFKYGSEVFEHFYVVKFKKFTIVNSNDRTKKFQPDLLLIAKNFKKWMFIEVELVKANMGHTFKQIDCFLNPEFDPDDLTDYVIKHNPSLSIHDSSIRSLVTSNAPGLLLIFDSHSNKIFESIYNQFGRIKICVFEVHKTTNHPHEAYRISGDYPYDISNSCKLIYFDDQHYKFSKPDIVSSITAGSIVLYHDMTPINATIIKGKKKSDIFLKIIDNPFPKDLGLQFSIEVHGNNILQRI